MAAQLAELAVFGLPDSYITDYTKKIAAVTKDDVRRVARKYLDPDHLTIVVVGDRKTLAEPLAKLAPVEKRDLDGNPLAAGRSDIRIGRLFLCTTSRRRGARARAGRRAERRIRRVFLLTLASTPPSRLPRRHTATCPDR